MVQDASGAPRAGAAADRDGRLMDDARQWVVDHYTYNSTHLINTLEWLDRIAPNASLALRLAALTHDMERAFPGPDSPKMTSLTDPEYNRLHSERSARIVGAWLRANGAPEPLTTEVEALVTRHEVGGNPDANLLQAADSISFLDVNVDLALNWVRSGRFSADDVRGKLDYMLTRIQVPAVTTLAEPYHARAVERLAGVAAEAGTGGRDATA
jgi:hypothetical protein